MGINVIRAVKDGTLSDLISEFSASSVDDLFASVGYAKFTPKKILTKLQALIDPKTLNRKIRRQSLRPLTIRTIPAVLS